MESWLTTLITQSLTYSIFIIAIIAFLESLALVGLLLPGIVLMSIIGTFIGNGKLLFYPSWIAGFFGCFLGDWCSYYIGLYFKKWLYSLNCLRKNFSLLNKTKSFLYKHSIITILVGRFIGPTRPLVPMVAGMLKLPKKNFFFPSILGCILWPPVYFFPGIITGIAINIPENAENNYFKWILLIIFILIWTGIWLISKWWKIRKVKEKKNMHFIKKNIGYISFSITLLGILGLILIQFHPTMIIFRKFFSAILL